MDIIKWTKSLKPKISNAVESFWKPVSHSNLTDFNNWTSIPSVNIAEGKSHYDISIAVPGMNKKDIQIAVQDGHLIVSSEKDYHNEEKNGNWLKREYGYASFRRVLPMPENFDEDEIKARMKDGVLKVRLGKLKGKSSDIKQIAVTKGLSKNLNSTIG